MSIVTMSTVVGLLAATLAVAPAPAEESAWIVETAPGAVETVAAVAEDLVGEPVETFDDAFSGVAVELTDAEAGMLEQRADVVAVHPDVEITLFDTQSSAPWHLSRLDQAAAPADGTYSYPASAGAGVRVYIVDSGIAPNAGQLGSRLLPGVSALAGDGSTADCQGHGTHVAGIVASATYGVAKRASVVPVRVFSCSGSTSSSTVISGLNWIATNHPAGTPGVVNMSLGGPASSPLDSAVQNLINRGMIVTVAAGNGGADQIGDDACSDSPARLPAALTVGATTTTDARAGYSNFGSCLDLFAPGSAVRSLSHTNASAYVTMSGTSMATPVVAGVAALAWSEAPGTSARQVEASIIASARTGAVGSPGAGSPNRLAATAAEAPVASAPPTGGDASALLASNRAFVGALYGDFLDRAATQSEESSLADSIVRGSIDRYGAATMLSRSDEWITTVVTGFYLDTLGRQPDQTGLRGWISAARSGMPVAQIAAGFYSSPEYFATIGRGTTPRG
ncbi:S8 family serine peptidase [Microcella daejeonensis]|uniref:S8 family serine peptidase n=1 Tax=Microcella daejeonensis TaxID=2994971 RepID=UPI00226D5F3D|nr:S8 family serine peptidase [Microcella daejeonensis]WAB84018.1 S8 family serine peptidase [Microcella daejeonensis]